MADVDVFHDALVGDDAIHQIMYVGTASPGFKGAHKFWLDTLLGDQLDTGAILKQINPTNDGWLVRADIAAALLALQTALQTAINLKSPLASPALTGNPTTPTPAPGDNDTSVANTAFVTAAIAAAITTLTTGVSSVFGRTGVVVKQAGDYAVADVTGAAPLASPALTGTPTAPTATLGTNTAQLATTAFVAAAIAALIGAAPAALDTIKELADAINDDASYAATITSLLALKAPLASPTFTGTVTVPDQLAGDNSGKAANTKYVDAAVAAGGGASGAASGDLTGFYPGPSLATSGASAGSYGDSTHVPAVTVDAKGRITAVSAVAISGVGASSPSGESGVLMNHPPTTALFSLSNLAGGTSLGINQGTSYYSIKRTDLGASSVELVSFQGKAVPAGSAWTATLGFWSTPYGRGSKCRAGLSLLENATLKSLNLFHNTEAGTPGFNIFAYANLGTFSSAPFSGSALFGGRLACFMRVAYDGTNYTFSISNDFGETWEVVATLAKATYFTTAADRIGVALDTGGFIVAGDCRMDIFYYSDPDF